MVELTALLGNRIWCFSFLDFRRVPVCKTPLFARENGHCLMAKRPRTCYSAMQIVLPSNEIRVFFSFY